MLITMKRDGDRYVVYGREGGSGEERLDTYMDQSRDFRTREAAVEWLKKFYVG